jgi:hypothetical protein
MEASLSQDDLAATNRCGTFPKAISHRASPPTIIFLGVKAQFTDLTLCLLIHDCNRQIQVANNLTFLFSHHAFLVVANFQKPTHRQSPFLPAQRQSFFSLANSNLVPFQTASNFPAHSADTGYLRHFAALEKSGSMLKRRTGPTRQSFHAPASGMLDEDRLNVIAWIEKGRWSAALIHETQVILRVCSVTGKAKPR